MTAGIDLPLEPGKAETMTHDYVRYGTTTLFAVLNVLDGSVLGRSMQRHRHQEFIRFLNAVEALIPAGKLVHAILDNDGTQKHPEVTAWLDRHPRWTFRYTPTSDSPSGPHGPDHRADESIACCDGSTRSRPSSRP